MNALQRSQIEDTVLSILRDQTKQDQILQSSEALIKANSDSKSESTSSGKETDSADTEANKSKNDSNENSDSNPESKTQESDKTKDDVKKDSTQTTTPSKGSTFKFRTFSCSICHKIFLSYVTMLKHRLSHKLSDGSLNSNEENSNTVDTTLPSFNKDTDNQKNNEMRDVNGDKEAANQALASSILKRSREVVFNKMRLNSSTNTSGATIAKSDDTGAKPVINTTDLLEKLARGGITTQSIEKSLNSNPKSSIKGQEVITIETNNNNTNILNLQLSASTSANSSNNLNTNRSDNNNGLDDIIINADLELDVLKDGVIMSDDLQQLIAVNDGKEGAADDLPVNEVLLNLDDIENGNEVWITITDSSAYVQVPNNTTNS